MQKEVGLHSWPRFLVCWRIFSCLVKEDVSNAMYQYESVYYCSLRSVKLQKSNDQRQWSSIEPATDTNLSLSPPKPLLGCFSLISFQILLNRNKKRKRKHMISAFYKADYIYLFNWDRTSMSSVFLKSRFKQIIQAASQAACAFLGTDSKTVSRHIKLGV